MRNHLLSLGLTLFALAVAWPFAGRDEGAAASLPVRARVPALAGGDGAISHAQEHFTTSVQVTREGADYVITVTVVSRAAMTAVVDVEVIAPNGRRVDQQYHDAKSVPGGIATTEVFRWSPAGAAPGEYRVNVGLFAPGPEWRALLHWHDAAARFQVP
ncbi:MAG: hypothetical protein ACKVVT_11845 [Dehalococcoidia bacterium]